MRQVLNICVSATGDMLLWLLGLVDAALLRKNCAANAFSSAGRLEYLDRVRATAVVLDGGQRIEIASLGFN